MIYRLTYVSAVASATAATLASAMQDILAVSVANNRRDDITGLLFCDGEVFAQALEGPVDLVEACFTRIARDRRSVGPIVRDRATATARAFPRWSMCGLTLSAQDDALLAPGHIGYDVARASPGVLWQLLTSLAERHGPQLDAEHARFTGG